MYCLMYCLYVNIFLYSKIVVFPCLTNNEIMKRLRKLNEKQIHTLFRNEAQSDISKTKRGNIQQVQNR